MRFDPTGLMQWAFAPWVRRTAIYTAADLEAQLLKAITWTPRVGRGGNAFAGKMCLLPNGVYEFGETVDLQKTVAQGHLADQQNVFIRGEGYGNTIFQDAGSGVTMFNAKNLRLNWEGIQVVGDNNGLTKFAKLGDEAADTPVFRSSFKDIFLTNINKGFIIGQLFDTIFSNIFVLGMNGTDACVFDVLAHYIDNSNYLQFNLAHFEQAAAATFLRTRSSLGANQYHQNFNFYAPHMETRAWNTRCLDLEGLINSKFSGGVFTRNNTSPTGDGVLYSAAVPIGRFKDCYNINFHGGNAQHVGTAQADTPKLWRLEGATRGIVFEDMYMAPGLTEVSPGIDDLIDNAGTVATEDAVRFRNVQLSDRSHAQVNSPVAIADRTNGNRIFTLSDAQNAAGATDLVVKYGNSAGGTGKVTTARFHNSGMFNPGAIAPVFQQSIANNASATYSIPNPDSANASKRGMYFIYENGPDNDVAAIIYHNGAVLTPLSLGAGVVAATADPGTASKLSVFLAGNTLTLTNRLGNTRTFCIVPFGAGANG